MGVPSACLYLPEQKEVPQARLGGHTGRYAMQTLGTEWGRDLMGPNFWIEMWHSHVEATGNEVVIVDDIRFEEELQAVLEYKNAVVVGLTRPGLPPLPPRWKFWEKVHRSERFEPQAFGLPTLVNDSTPEALYQRFNQLLSIR